MQKTITALLIFFYLQANAQNVAIGTTIPANSAQLELTSTTKGLLMPRMTTAQRNAIASPVVGLQIFNLDDQCTDLYDGTYWIKNCGLKVISTITDPGHPAPNSWIQKANVGGGGRDGGAGFSIGNKGYIGTGLNTNNSYKNDFWEYDQDANTWAQKANFGGPSRQLAVGFSIGTKGYIGTGDNFNRLNDFWEYNPANNEWTQKAAFGGTARQSAVGFSIGTKGYIGTGNAIGGSDEFWEYDPATNVWSMKADFPGGTRYGAAGFSIGSKGYIGTGIGANFTLKKDFWEYDPAKNTWTQKANFGGTARDMAAGLSIGNKGYIGLGHDPGFPNDFWEYNPATDAWTQKAIFGGSARISPVGFSIGNKGYIGTGWTIGGLNASNDFWEYLDDNVTGSTYSSNTVSTIKNTVSDGAWTLANGTVYNANTGNVGIGTNFPAQKLEVAGTTKTTNLQLTNGAGNGAVLTSDAAGNAAWVNNNVGCIIRAQSWTLAASSANYNGAFAPAVLTSTGIIGDTRLINSGAMNVFPGDPTTTGLFTAPSAGYYQLNLKVRGAASSARLLLLGSLNGAPWFEIFDMQTTDPCGNCTEISHTQIMYLNAGDTHRVLRSSASMPINDMIISYRKL